MLSDMSLILSGAKIQSPSHSDSQLTPNFWEFQLVKIKHLTHGWNLTVCAYTLFISFQDYFDIITNPMDLSTINRKLSDGVYKDGWEVRYL